MIPIKKTRQPAVFKGQLVLSTGKFDINKRLDKSLCLPEVVKLIEAKKPDTEESSKSTRENDVVLDEDETECGPTTKGSLYICSNSICQGKFITYEGLLHHTRAGRCVVRTRKRNAAGEFRFRWFSRHGLSQAEAIKARGRYFRSHQDDLPRFNIPPNLDLIELDIKQTFEKGFALVEDREVVRFSGEQIAFVQDQFNIGQQTGNKVRPEKIVERMRKQKVNGQKLFKPNQVLKLSQVKSLCSRFFAKLTLEGSKSAEKDDDDEVAALEEAEETAELVFEEQIKDDIREALDAQKPIILDDCPLWVSLFILSILLALLPNF